MTRLLAALAALSLASGCATMLDHKSKSFSLQSIPDGAHFELYEEESATLAVASGVTPASLHLLRGDGYFQAKDYRVTVHKEGYETETVELGTSINSSYWANLLIFPLLTPWPVIGMLIVDPLTGAMYDIDVPTAVVLRKSPAPEAATAAPDPGLPPHE